MADMLNAPATQPVPPTPSQQPSEEITIDLMELMYRLLAHWKLIVCFTLIGAVAMGLYSVYMVTPMYQAKSTIYVLNRTDSAINLSDLQVGTQLTNDYIKVFDMWEVHEEVISHLNLPYTYGQMRGMLNVTNTNNTRMLDITITNADPKMAANIANEYAKVVSQFIADTMAMDKPSIMSVALVPSNPVSPNKTRNVLLGGILGGVAAAGIVTLLFLLDDKYKTAEDIRRYTGLVTLAMIPVEDSMTDAKQKKSKKSRRNT